mmetsp:Transcript_40745/g.161499  ORF Transcript_40745/g.161499 Transcript_40745/m.161499 type:complete len:91 (+) Transcript_40745:1695-1967(+)
MVVSSEYRELLFALQQYPKPAAPRESAVMHFAPRKFPGTRLTSAPQPVKILEALFDKLPKQVLILAIVRAYTILRCNKFLAILQNLERCA